jgi:hypothetical protein
LTTTLQCINSQKPYTLAGFKPGIFCSVGGRDDHYATPPGGIFINFCEKAIKIFVGANEPYFQTSK